MSLNIQPKTYYGFEFDGPGYGIGMADYANGNWVKIQQDVAEEENKIERIAVEKAKEAYIAYIKEHSLKYQVEHQGSS